ncbi:hypothetical protein O181_059470 [Austropuccinia psidii MF-1]|uniref:Uncharacterized protein n=1 Tax=Austropuccinia psidii MF-1 TaxID=1389203 RepID=A0A9Q3EII1_9BASI|nr:hypothetical protein [Austropuccinia psidii MF-1]
MLNQPASIEFLRKIAPVIDKYSDVDKLLSHALTLEGLHVMLETIYQSFIKKIHLDGIHRSDLLDLTLTFVAPKFDQVNPLASS